MPRVEIHNISQMEPFLLSCYKKGCNFLVYMGEFHPMSNDAGVCTCRAVVLPSNSQLLSIHIYKDGNLFIWILLYRDVAIISSKRRLQMWYLCQKWWSSVRHNVSRHVRRRAEHSVALSYSSGMESECPSWKICRLLIILHHANVLQ